MSVQQITGQFETTFTVTVHDRDALHAYMALYPEDWPDEKSIIKSIIWTSYNYNERQDPAGTEGFADMPEGIVSVKWESPDGLDIYHEGEWW